MAKATNQRDGLQLRQEILKRLKTQVQLYLGKEPADLRRYAQAYKKNIERSRWTPSTKKELYASISRADIVFGGDFHAFGQAQRVHVRVLRELASLKGPESKKVVLGLECVESRYQKVLDQYVAGELTEDVFLSKVKWNKNWGFPFAQYKPLFDIVKKNGGRCLALNDSSLKRSGRSLVLRDKHAAQILRQAYQKKQNHEMIYVIYGDLHIAKENLPHRVEQGLIPAPRSVILYLNPEKIYFQLARKNLEHKIDVLRFSKNEFCLIESPPWVKWQSYLLFLEENIDQVLPSEESQLDYTEHTNSLIRVIAGDLQVKSQFDGTVHSFYDQDFLEMLKHKLSRSDISFVEKMVAADLSFFYPSEQVAFLSRGTVNHAAHLAAMIFHAQLCQRKNILFGLPKDLTKLVWIEAMAFALSKLINPHRKSLSLNDLKKQLAAFSPDDQGEEALKIALDQKMKDLLLVYGTTPPIDNTYPVKSVISFYKGAKILGGILGEQIFLSFKAGRLSRKNLLKWLEHPIEVDEFHVFYIQVLKELDKMDLGETHG